MFVKVHDSAACGKGRAYFVNSDNIEGITKERGSTAIEMTGGRTYRVREEPEDITSQLGGYREVFFDEELHRSRRKALKEQRARIIEDARAVLMDDGGALMVREIVSVLVEEYGYENDKKLGQYVRYALLSSDHFVRAGEQRGSGWALRIWNDRHDD